MGGHIMTRFGRPERPVPGVADGAAGHRSGGFTLIEVMVALLLVTLALAAAVELTSGSARQLEDMTETTQAHWVAMNHLAQLRASRRFPDTGETSGHAREAGHTWYWKQTVRNGPGGGLRTVSIRVSATRDGTALTEARGVFGKALAMPSARQP